MMPGSRSKDAWIWVAVAAITLGSLARAQAGIENARAYASPVIKFLAGSPMPEPAGSASTHRTASPAPNHFFGTILELLPVFFVGLVAPFSVQSVRWPQSSGPALSAPNPPGFFPRPPPILFA
jgi:hypothetical protein